MDSHKEQKCTTALLRCTRIQRNDCTIITRSEFLRKQILRAPGGENDSAVRRLIISRGKYNHSFWSMIMATRAFTIKVPATSANIGPGFDVVGLSLSLWLTLTVTVTPPHSSSPALPPAITYSGEGADEVPLDAYKNLTTRVALYVLRCNSISQFPPNLTIHAHNDIPFGRGLGSSGAAVIAGVLLGNELGELGLPLTRMLDFALMVERHPDNVTAALVGGFVGSYLRELDSAATEAASVPLSEVLPEYPPDAGEDWGLNPPQPPLGIGHYVRFGWSKPIKAVAIIPRFELSTARAREVLPLEYSRKDLVRSRLWLSPALTSLTLPLCRSSTFSD